MSNELDPIGFAEIDNTSFVGDEEEFYGHLKKLSKAAERREAALAIQEELDELGDLYDLPQGLRIPGVVS
ncbi:hypothetical protein ACFWNC_14625 [Streptomyces sp. NPDC058369]|uniref:hypothetical protein n=1 Tax=Streptomyces sp. NPDC058369 TaxID=3346462 RepID=UPI0036688DD3